MTSRFTFLGTCCVLAAIAVVLRLHQLQVTQGDRWQARADDARGAISTLPGERGRITDINGVVLAQDAPAIDISVIPSAFREQSLLHALADALVLCGVGAESPAAAQALRWSCITDPRSAVTRLARLPAAVLGTTERGGALGAVQGAASGAARMDLLRAPHGQLSMERGEAGARLAQALRVLKGAGLPATLAKLSAQRGDLAEVLRWDTESVVTRCLEELRVLTALARACKGDLPALLERMSELARREEAWKQQRIHEEMRDAAALDEFGTVKPDPESLGHEDWRALVHSVRAVHQDEDAAALALLRCSAWLSGEVPVTGLLGAVTGDADAVAHAAAFGLPEQAVEPVLDTWFAQREDSGVASPLRARRERELRALWRRGRSFALRRAAPAELSSLIVGPGRLAACGFSVSPRLVRQPLPETAAFRTLGLLLGGVATETGAPLQTNSVEAALNDALDAEDGESVAGGVAGGVVLSAPKHGTEQRLTLDWKVQRAVEDAVQASSSAEPGAVVLLDIATGGVIAMVSTPLPRDLDAALAERRTLELERTLLRRVLGRGEGWARQRLLSLEKMSVAVAEPERTLLVHACELSAAQIRQRLDFIGEKLAMSGAYHRAADSPEHLPPGSVFKAVTVLAALQDGKCSAQQLFECQRNETRGFLRCKGHGHVDARNALKLSCNSWCYEAGTRLGTERMIAWYRKLGLFDPVPGLLAADERLARELSSDDARALAIGGGSLRVAPVRAAGVAASIATGRVVRPHLSANAAHAPGEVLADEVHLATVRAGMRGVVEAGGTAGTVAGLAHLRIAAKTGTADYEASSGERLHQAWFVGYAPAGPGEQPRIAFAAMRAHTHDKGADAAPLAARALEAYGAARPEGKWW